MLDEGHHPAGHEAAAPHGSSGPRHFGDLDDTPAGGDLDAASRSCRFDLEALHATCAGVHEDLYSVASHRNTDATAPDGVLVA